MVNRINLILKAKNITAKQFAEEIGVQPSGMSHILSERNKPSLDFIMKVVTRYPEIDISWLMFGKGEMYDSNARVQPQAVAAAPAAAPAVASAEPVEIQKETNPTESVVKNNDNVSGSVSSEVPYSGQLNFEQPSAQPAAPAREMDLFSAPVSQPEPVAPVAPVAAAKPVVAPVVVAQEEQKEEKKEEKASINENRKNESAPAAAFIPAILSNQKKIVKFVVLYDDHTFSEYYPE